METKKNKVLKVINNTFNPIKIVENTWNSGVNFCTQFLYISKQSFKHSSNLFEERSKHTRELWGGLNELNKLFLGVVVVFLLSLSFLAGSAIGGFTIDILPNGASSNVSAVYTPSKGTGAELTNNAKDTLKNFIELLQGSLKQSDGFLKAVFSERPLYLESDTITINGETLQSPRKLIYGSALGIAYSLVTLFIIFDCIKILTGHGGDFKKLLYKYLIGFLVVSLSGILLNYSIDMANSITKDLLVNNSDPNRSKIGQVLDSYFDSVKGSYQNEDKWPWDYWWGDEAGWNPINILRDYVQIAIALIPMIALLFIVLMNGFALLTNWVIMYVLAGIVPIAVCFYMVDWNHSFPKNFINLWVQNLLQLPMFSFVFYAFITFIGGGVVVKDSFKLALFFSFLSVMLNVNQNFGSIFSGMTSQAGNIASGLFAGIGTSVASATGSGALKSLGAVGSQASRSGKAFGKSAIGGKTEGVGGRIGQSANSFGQGLMGNKTSSYVANRAGRLTGKLGFGNKNITNGLNIAKETGGKVSRAVQSLKTKPDSKPKTKPEKIHLN